MLNQIGAALPVIGSLVVIETLLSVDNALAIAALAGRLPKAERRRMLLLGMIGAYGFRFLALLLAAWVLRHPWVKAAGALYLVYLMCLHLGAPEKKERARLGDAPVRFWPTFFAVQWIDAALSFDNVVAAAALSPKLWVVCTGVFLGMIAFRFLTGFCIALLKRFPILEPAAFLLVGAVGIVLWGELALGVEIGPLAKGAGLFSILGLALLYERYAGVRRALGPLVRTGRRVMGVVPWAQERVTALGNPKADRRRRKE